MGEIADAMTAMQIAIEAVEIYLRKNLYFFAHMKQDEK